MISKLKKTGIALTREQMKNVLGGKPINGGGPGPLCVVYGDSCSCTTICCDDLPCLGPYGGLGAGGHCGVYVGPPAEEA